MTVVHICPKYVLSYTILCGFLHTIQLLEKWNLGENWSVCNFFPRDLVVEKISLDGYLDVFRQLWWVLRCLGGVCLFVPTIQLLEKLIWGVCNFFLTIQLLEKLIWGVCKFLHTIQLLEKLIWGMCNFLHTI